MLNSYGETFLLWKTLVPRISVRYREASIIYLEEMTSLLRFALEKGVCYIEMSAIKHVRCREVPFYLRVSFVHFV